MKKDSLYVIQSDVTGAVKIGRSKNPIARLKQLQTGSPHKLKLLCELPEMGHKEILLHRRLSEYKTKKPPPKLVNPWVRPIIERK